MFLKISRLQQGYQRALELKFEILCPEATESDLDF